MIENREPSKTGSIAQIESFELIGKVEPKNPLDYKINKFIKRSFDFTSSLALIVLLSPLLLFLAAMVKLTSKGPVVFAQERITENNRPFNIYKFRTMIVESEDSTGPVFAKANDDRCTSIGKFLRRSSLDELPQLFNVLNGDMSVVGPRPERPYFVNTLKHEIRNYMDRHDVKAGITGWAQVHGLRGGDTSIQDRIDYDNDYIKNWSLFLDIKILFKTVFVLFRDFFGKIAY